jgi:SAM-dependent methyltransferase
MDLKERTENPNQHPWELARADMILELVTGGGTARRYADVGSGDLYFARRLSESSDAPVYAVDVNYPGQGREAGIVLCTDLNQVPTASTDCAILMDVLEHVDDDLGLLRSVNRILAPGGQVLVTVPAHAVLWSDHDEHLGHRRRYDRRSLLDVLQRAGLDIVECFYFFCLPCLVRAVSVGLARVGVRRRYASRVGLWPYSSRHPITRTLRAMLTCDFRLSRVLRSTPLSACGLSICAICRRTSG